MSTLHSVTIRALIADIRGARGPRIGDALESFLRGQSAHIRELSPADLALVRDRAQIHGVEIDFSEQCSAA